MAMKEKNLQSVAKNLDKAQSLTLVKYNYMSITKYKIVIILFLSYKGFCRQKCHFLKTHKFYQKFRKTSRTLPFFAIR